MLGELAVGRMRGGCVVLGLLCCLVAGVGSYTPWDLSWTARGDPSAWSWGTEAHSRAVAGSHPVAVQCQEAQLVVTVHRDLFGTGRLINAADLTLGPAACKHSSLNAAHNTVTFAAGLHECGSVVQVRSRAPGGWFPPRQEGLFSSNQSCFVLTAADPVFHPFIYFFLHFPIERDSSGRMGGRGEVSVPCCQLCALSLPR